MASFVARLLAAVPMPLLLVGPDNMVVTANAAAQALLGPGNADLTGRHLALAIRQPDLLDAVARALAGKPGLVRLVIPALPQDQVHEVTVTPVDEGALLAFADLTQAEAMDRMRRDFVANVSHELRTPLTAITGFIETLQGAARDDTAARTRFLDIMRHEAERMNRLVRDLLHLSRVESEERVRPDTTIDLAGITRSVVDSLQPLARLGQVTIEAQGVGTALPLRADADQMVQVLTNLIENAIRYGSAPGDRVTVRLTRQDGPRGPQLRIDVADQGAGIDPRHLPRLTERFYRVDAHRSREKGGTGLGLAIVKHIVQRHRGRLLIESEAGTGSVFSVLLPMI